MWRDMWEDLATRPPQWLETFLQADGVQQVTALALILAMALPLRSLLSRTFADWEQRGGKAAWLRPVFTLLRPGLLPFAAWGIGRLVIGACEQLGVGYGFLAWAVPFLGIWFAYRLLEGVLGLRLAGPQVRVWCRQVVFPMALLLALLHATGNLSAVLQWKLSPRENMDVTVGSVVSGLVVLGAFFFASRGVRHFLENVFLPQAGVETGLAQTLATLATYAVIVLGAVQSLSVVGADLTTLTVVAGGLSVGLGFGLKEIVSNFMSGLILMLERSIGAGDVVRIADTMGIVHRVGVRATVVRTRDNVELIIPNAQFLTEPLTNFTRADPLVRLRIRVGVSYSSDPRQVEEALLAAARSSPVLLDPKPSVQFRDFGDSALLFDLLVWTDDAANMLVTESATRHNIQAELGHRGIVIPFPQRDVHIRSDPPCPPRAFEPCRDRSTPATSAPPASAPRKQ